MLGACSQVEGRAVSESEDEDDGAAAEAAAQAAAVAAAQADGANVVLENASRPSAGVGPGRVLVELDFRALLSAVFKEPTGASRHCGGAECVRSFHNAQRRDRRKQARRICRVCMLVSYWVRALMRSICPA